MCLDSSMFQNRSRSAVRCVVMIVPYEESPSAHSTDPCPRGTPGASRLAGSAAWARGPPMLRVCFSEHTSTQSTMGLHGRSSSVGRDESVGTRDSQPACFDRYRTIESTYRDWTLPPTWRRPRRGRRGRRAKPGGLSVKRSISPPL